MHLFVLFVCHCLPVISKTFTDRWPCLCIIHSPCPVTKGGCAVECGDPVEKPEIRGKDSKHCIPAGFTADQRSPSVDEMKTQNSEVQSAQADEFWVTLTRRLSVHSTRFVLRPRSMKRRLRCVSQRSRIYSLSPRQAESAVPVPMGLIVRAVTLAFWFQQIGDKH